MTLNSEVAQFADRLYAVNSRMDAHELRNSWMRMNELWIGVDTGRDLAETLELVSAHAALAAAIVRKHTVPPFF